jgi:SAM domain (Sterile alpha motif)
LTFILTNSLPVQKWLKRHCSEYAQYHLNFQNHEITGKSLLRLTDESLERMGIDNNEDRDAVLRELLKLRLKTNMQDLKDLELSNNTIYENTSNSK